MGTAIALGAIIVGAAMVYVGINGSQKKAWKLITHPLFGTPKAKPKGTVA